VFPIKDNVPTRTFPVVTVALIAVNVVVWIWEVTSSVTRGLALLIAVIVFLREISAVRPAC
jgi:membrane associated rhomboid family serine protease